MHALLHGFAPQGATDCAIAGSVLELTRHGDSNLVAADEISAAPGASP